MSTSNMTCKDIIESTLFSLQRAIFVSLANVKKALPNTKEYWKAVEIYRENESALENYKSYWGTSKKINQIN